MSDVNLTVSAPKEVVDYLVALDGLAQKIVAQESPTQIAVEEIQVILGLYKEASVALSEVENQTDEVLDAVEMFGRRIVYRFLGKPVMPVVIV